MVDDEKSCRVPLSLMRKVLKVLEKEGYEQLGARLRNYVMDRKVTQEIDLSSIPPWIDVGELYGKKELYKLMQENGVSKVRIKGALASLPSCEVISRKPILITKVGFYLVKERVWNS